LTTHGTCRTAPKHRIAASDGPRTGDEAVHHQGAKAWVREQLQANDWKVGGIGTTFG
jgi:hypothetical protein